MSFVTSDQGNLKESKSTSLVLTCLGVRVLGEAALGDACGFDGVVGTGCWYTQSAAAADDGCEERRSELLWPSSHDVEIWKI